MASTGILKVAFLLLLALTTAYAQGTDYDRYSDGRSSIGKLADGIAVNVRAIDIHLRQRNISYNLRKVVSSLVRIQVMREEELIQHSNRQTRETFDVILRAIGNDSCNWLKVKNIVDPTSTCSLPEMKRLLTILDMFLVTDAIHNDSYIKTTLNGRGRNAASCYCPWFKFEVLNNNCSSTNLGRDILGLGQKCTFCTDQEDITSKVDSCLCHEDDSNCS